MRRWTWGIGVAALVLAGTGTAVWTDRSEFCGDCHSMERVYATWKASPHSMPPAGRPRAECVDCHIRWDASGFVQAKAHGLNDVLAEYTHATAWTESPHPRLVYSENCLTCHEDAASIDSLPRERLPERIRELGLRGPHDVHFTLARFGPEQATELASLRAMSSPTTREKERRRWLEKSERGNCAQCHERTRTTATGGTVVDRRLSQDTRNPLVDCMTCHVDVAHPRDAERGEAVPSFQTCRQCHNGQYHGVLGYIFPADCDREPDVALGEDAYCRKCHPGFKAK